ncbi:hypothetical protein [Alkalimarinus sediminis]|uniref:Transmembrane protein n=1 Tax=Alkalimarinus sediminis TaxID=1632866 RepID=A0A9E8HI46_9ALTE|nr:hypothetical protein [Alkalimarinus sediminis]UZW74612.1 hypothetical protein NNL22_16555 [Alkalimarinus sediminis]
MNKHHKLSLIVEFTALIVLIGSMVWIGQIKQSGAPLATWQLALPVVASFFVLTGFLSNMYFRWISSAGGKSALTPRNQTFFWLLALSLLSVWCIAVIKTFWIDSV